MKSVGVCGGGGGKKWRSLVESGGLRVKNNIFLSTHIK